MGDRIVVIGGYGVFGGYLSEALARKPGVELFVAGRSLQKAKDFCDIHGGMPCVIDRNGPELNAQLEHLTPSIVIDAAGPFQSLNDPHNYSVVEAALACRAHYIDLSDDADFTVGITRFEDEANSAGVAIISGASSVPGISSAAVRDLSEGFKKIIRIDSTILPGNKAPRGRSVMQAILAQVGKPLKVYEAGRYRQVPGWSHPRHEHIAGTADRPAIRRWSTYIGAPDLALFPSHFNAQSVYFRAGLELRGLQFGLWGLGFLTRFKMMRSLVPLTSPLLWIARQLEGFGTDRGAMIVRVLGQTADGRNEQRQWTLVAEAGDGPQIPTLAARILCDQIRSGALKPGARPCLSLFSTEDVMQCAGDLKLSVHHSSLPALPLFQQALASDYDILPELIRRLHDNLDMSIWTGTAEVYVGPTRMAAFVRRLVGFPSKATKLPVKVHMRRDGEKEIWTRQFGDQTFHSVLKLWKTAGLGQVTERFGPCRFVIDLRATQDGLEYPVSRGWLFGVPLPAWLLPKSQAIETQVGRAFQFDVAISLPLIGLLVHYKGRLWPQNENARQDEV